MGKCYYLYCFNQPQRAWQLFLGVLLTFSSTSAEQPSTEMRQALHALLSLKWAHLIFVTWWQSISGVPEIPASFYQVFPYPEIPCIRINFYWLIVLSLLSTETGVTTSLKLSVLNIASLFCSWFVVLKRNKRRHDFIWFCVLMNFIPFPLHSKFSCAIGSILFLHLLCNLPGEVNQWEEKKIKD